MLVPALALTATLAVAAPPAGPLVALSLGALRRPDLALHLVDPASSGTPALALDDAPPARKASAGRPVCSGDVCQPAVAVPGFEPSYGRVHRSEAFVALLTKAHVEPLATMAWALVATGVRFDWTPAALDGPNGGGHGWGSVFLRLRLRVDAHNAPTIPPRPK